MLRALCLLALLLPAQALAQLESHAVGFVFTDSLVFPFAYYDGSEWSPTSSADLAPYGPFAWQTVDLRTGGRSSMESGLTPSDYVEFEYPAKQHGYLGDVGVGLPVTWDGPSTSFALAFIPAVPRGARFVDADTTVGSRFLHEALRRERWQGDVRNLVCSKPDMPGADAPTHCSAGGWFSEADTTGLLDYRGRVLRHLHTMHIEVWFWDENQVAVHFDSVPGDEKMLGDDFRPLYYLDLPEPYVIGDARMWEGSYGYVARLHRPSDGAASMPTLVVEQGWD